MEESAPSNKPAAAVVEENALKQNERQKEDSEEGRQRICFFVFFFGFFHCSRTKSKKYVRISPFDSEACEGCADREMEAAGRACKCDATEASSSRG